MSEQTLSIARKRLTEAMGANPDWDIEILMLNAAVRIERQSDDILHLALKIASMQTEIQELKKGTRSNDAQ